MEWLRMTSGTGWLEAALLIGLFWAALVHPDRIRSVTAFRIATYLLGASVVAPVVIQWTLQGVIPRQFLGDSYVMFWVAIPPVLSMMAVILAVLSVTPRSRGSDD
jgi:hypothetical protein